MRSAGQSPVPPPTPNMALNAPPRWRSRPASATFRPPSAAILGPWDDRLRPDRAAGRPARRPGSAAVLCDIDGTLSTEIVADPRVGDRYRAGAGAVGGAREPLPAGRLRQRAPGQRRPPDGRPRSAHFPEPSAGLEVLRPGDTAPTLDPGLGHRGTAAASSPPAWTGRTSTAAGCGWRTRAPSRRSTGGAPRIPSWLESGLRRLPRSRPSRAYYGSAWCWSCGRSPRSTRGSPLGGSSPKEPVRPPRSTAATTAPTSTPSPPCASSRATARSGPGYVVGVASAEVPDEIRSEADLVVDSPDSLLDALGAL